jgi:putative endonuclease
MNQNGAEAEQAALVYLQQQGLKLLEKNYRCRYGEIDLVCQDRQTLVFVEVRLRQNPRFGGAAASITAQKQAKLIRAAQHYLGTRSNPPPCRFDVVLLQGMQPGQIEWIRDAFGA